MAISFACPSCDKVFTVADAYAGKKTKCSACATLLIVPEPDVADDFEIVEEPPAPPPDRPIARPKPVDDRPARRPNGPVRRGLASSSTRSEEETYGADEPEERPKPVKRKRPRRERESSGYDRGSRGGGNAVIVGILMIVGAIIWFVVGLMNDIIFFYPPV